MHEAIELYDLAADPAETTDVAGENPEVVEKMRDLMERERSLSRPHLEPIRVQGRYFR